MIRDMLRRASERPAGETENTNGDDTPSNTPATAEEAEVITIDELSTDSESAENKSTSGSAEDKVSPPYESMATSQRTRTLPNGLTVTVHAEDEAATNLPVEGTHFLLKLKWFCFQLATIEKYEYIFQLFSLTVHHLYPSPNRYYGCESSPAVSCALSGGGRRKRRTGRTYPST